MKKEELYETERIGERPYEITDEKLQREYVESVKKIGERGRRKESV